MKRFTAYVISFMLIGLGVLGLMEQLDLFQTWETAIATTFF
jgi:hypothetical protein